LKIGTVGTPRWSLKNRPHRQKRKVSQAGRGRATVTSRHVFGTGSEAIRGLVKSQRKDSSGKKRSACDLNGRGEAVQWCGSKKQKIGGRGGKKKQTASTSRRKKRGILKKQEAGKKGLM